MAIEVVRWVFAHSRSKNAERLVMLAIADACNSPDGTGAWMSNAALCAKTNLSERAVQNATAGCERLGELKVERGRGRGGVNRFTVVMAGGLPAVNPAESAPFTETPQNLHPAESAPFTPATGHEEQQVRAQKPAESAGQGSDGKGAESAPGTVKNSSTKSSASPKKRPRSPKKVEPYREDVERICNHLADRVEANGSPRPKITNEWRVQARLLLDEQRPIPVDVERVINAIDWALGHHFWHQNILSMPTLRKQWEKLRLARVAEMNEQVRRRPAGYQPYRNPENQDDYNDWKKAPV